MRRLFYATFEKGYGEITEKFIKKQDKTAHIKRTYADSVIFFADEKFTFANNMFLDSYIVLDCTKKDGNGAINAEMKHLLEKKDLKIQFPVNIKKFKLTFVKYSDKLLIDQNLRNAFETSLKKLTKKQIGFYNTDAELVLLTKEDGTCLFMKKITRPCEFDKFNFGFGISVRVVFALNFLSCPAEKEVSLDPFADTGLISYVRAYCFKKANVIANEKDSAKIDSIKKLAKTLKDKSFSVMKYDFLSDIFPIHFIDKIVTVPPTDKNILSDFIKKAYTLKVKKIVLMSRSKDVISICKGMFKVTEQYQIGADKIYVLELEK